MFYAINLDSQESYKIGAEEDYIVGNTMVGEMEVSTVLLAATYDDLSPLYETLIFGAPLDQEGERYATYEEAVKGHAKWVERAQWVLGTQERCLRKLVERRDSMLDAREAWAVKESLVMDKLSEGLGEK